MGGFAVKLHGTNTHFFNFNTYLKHLPQHKKNIDQTFLEWFIGFSEGDGSFGISPAGPQLSSNAHASLAVASPWSPAEPQTNQRKFQEFEENEEAGTDENQENCEFHDENLEFQRVSQTVRPPQRLFFIITQKEVQVLRMLRSKIGFGKVTSHGEYFRYIVAKSEYIDKLIHIFNGNLILNKTKKRFENWLHARNTIHQRRAEKTHSQFHLICLKNDTTSPVGPTVMHNVASYPLRGCLATHDHGEATSSVVEKNSFRDRFSTSAWLSGFIDAEGCFSINRSMDKRYSLGYRVRCRFLIDQKDEKAILEEIRKEFQAGYVLLRKGANVPELMYRYECTSIKDLYVVKNYLTRFPLLSRKKISGIRVFKMVNYIERRKDLPWTGKVLERINRLIEGTDTDSNLDFDTETVTVANSLDRLS
jgi:hypothetical protein